MKQQQQQQHKQQQHKANEAREERACKANADLAEQVAALNEAATRSLRPHTLVA